MSQADIAGMIGTTEKNIGRWENGQNQPSVSSLAAIAKATGRDIDFFLTADSPSGSDDEDEEVAALPLDDYLRVLVRKIIREEVKS